MLSTIFIIKSLIQQNSSVKFISPKNDWLMVHELFFKSLCILFTTSDGFNPMPFVSSGIVVACVCVCVSINHELVRPITHQPLKLEPPNFDQRCISKFQPRMHHSTIKVPIDFGLDWPWCSLSFFFFLFCFNIRLIIHLRWFVYIQWDQSVQHMRHGTAHIRFLICTSTGSHHGPGNSLVLHIGGTLGVQWAVDSTIGTGFYKLLSVPAKLYTPHMP